MAIFPCDWAYHRYPGKAWSAYITQAYASTLVVSHALRLCEEHAQELLVAASVRLAELDEQSSMSDTCEICSEKRDSAIFLKLYGRSGPPREFAADFCGPHCEQVAAELRAGHGRRLADR